MIFPPKNASKEAKCFLYGWDASLSATLATASIDGFLGKNDRGGDTWVSEAWSVASIILENPNCIATITDNPSDKDKIIKAAVELDKLGRKLTEPYIDPTKAEAKRAQYLLEQIIKYTWDKNSE